MLDEVDDISLRPVTENRFTKEWDAYFNKQLHRGGFCGWCGDAVEPIYNNDIEVFGRCPYKGEQHSLAALKSKEPDHGSL